MMNIKKLLMSGILCVCLLATGIESVSASSTSDKLDKANDEVDSLEESVNETQSELDSAEDQLVTVLCNISDLENDLEDKQTQIDVANEELEAAEEKRQAQYEAMKIRIKYMYENKGSSMLTTLLESDSLSDMLNRVEYMSTVYDSDKQLIANYEATVEEISALEETLESEMEELESMEASYEKKQSELETLTATLKEQVDDYETQLASAMEKVEEYEAQLEEERAAAAAKAAEEAAAKAAEEEAAREAAAQEAAAAAASSSESTSSSTDTASSQESSPESSSDTSSDSSSDSDANPSYTTGVSGSDVVAYARQFIGNSYVWGGTSLTNGCDCSGFVGQVFAHFGIFSQSTADNHGYTSYSLRSVGQEVSYANAQAGDIICYSGHVAIYEGGGMIVHAKGTAYGICEGSATYKTIICVRRVL